MSDGYWLDKRLVRASFERAAAGYERAAVLQREVAARLLERLDLVKIAPVRILDLGSGTGISTRLLGSRYPKAEMIALDLAYAMVEQSRRGFSFFARRFKPYRFVCGDMERLPFASGSFDLIFSNLTIQWGSDLHALFLEMRRVLRPGGLLMFTTLGPDTLQELRESWTAAGAGVHVNAFFDMHDVGDAMVEAGLAGPVLDVERITITYPEVAGLLRDLKGLGAHNVTWGRPRTLMGKGRMAAMTAAYEKYRRDGELPATYEVIYGHAWGAAGLQERRGDGSVAIGIDSLREMVRRG